MPQNRKRAIVVYFVLGLLVGSFAGLILGTLFFADRPRLVVVTAGAGALVFGVLGILFKEDVMQFFPWY